MRGGVVHDRDAEGIPGAAIDHETVAQREDGAALVEGDFGVVVLVARMAGARHVLPAAFHPAHRASGKAREERDEHVLRIDVALYAEAAADIERNDADASLGL